SNNIVDTTNLKAGLLLPLSGNLKIFGDTIRAGFMAAKNKDKDNVQIIVYDTSKQSIPVIVEKAKKAKVDLLVGPLLKNKVVEIKSLKLNVPVLALNRIENIQQRTNFCYYALAPEDEAQNAADKIYQAVHHQPLILVQSGEFGIRVSNAFAQQWKKNTQKNNTLVKYFDSANNLSSQLRRGEMRNNLVTLDIDKVPGV